VLASAVTVSYTVSTTEPDDATPGDDYAALSGTVTIPAGKSSATFTIDPVDDELAEALENVRVTLEAGSGYNVEPGGKSAVVALADNDKVVFDLDVNANGSLKDNVDLTKRYLPGYEGKTPKISSGATFNNQVYSGQRMKLIIDGYGSDNKKVSKVEFELLQTTSYTGYSGNKSDPTVEGESNKDDYSFQRNGNGHNPGEIATITVTRAGAGSAETTAHGGLYGGKMEATSTWVNFYAKDYGGWAIVRVNVHLNDENGHPLEVYFQDLSIPFDTTDDKIADKWQVQSVAKWYAQYGVYPLNAPLTAASAAAIFSPTADGEMRDPDGAGSNYVPQAEAGDAHTVLAEYRGYILDGGGFDGAGENGFPGGHTRLEPARKEILLEADRATVLNNVPAVGLSGILDGAAKVFSDAERGAGIYLYYLFDEANYVAPAEVRAASLGATRDTAAARSAGISVLASRFDHMLFVDTGIPVHNAATYDAGDLSERGSLLALSQLYSKYGPGNGEGFTKYEEAVMIVAAHEIVHLLVDIDDGFDAAEHIIGVQNKLDLMYSPSHPTNRELATVKFSHLLQKNLKTKSNQGF
jgi:hypothetical protein